MKQGQPCSESLTRLCFGSGIGRKHGIYRPVVFMLKFSYKMLFTYSLDTARPLLSQANSFFDLAK